MRYIVLIVALIYYSSSCFTQEIDSLKSELETAAGYKKLNLLNQLAGLLKTSEPDIAHNYALEAFDISQEKANTTAMAIALTNLGDINFLQSRFSDAYANFNEAHKCYIELNDSSGIANTLDKVANIYYKWSNYHQALEYYQRSLLIKEEINDTKGIAFSYNALGNIYFQLRNFVKAIELYSKSLEIDRKEENYLGISYTLNAIGNVYTENGEYNDALTNYKKSLEIARENNAMQGVTYSLQQIGTIYLKQGKYINAEMNFDKSLEISLHLNYKFGIARAHNLLGKLAFERGNLNKAKEHYTNSLNTGIETNFIEIILDNYKKLAELYSNEKKHEQAFIYFIKYTKLKDSVFNISTNTKIAEIQAKYDLKSKEKEIELLSRDKKLKALQLKRKNLLNFSLLIGLILILLIGLAIYSRARIKLKSAQALKKEVEERKRTETLLKASEERFDLAMQGANDGLWDWNIKSDEVYYSPRWKSMLGFENAEIKNDITEWNNRIHPDDFEQENKIRQSHLSDKSFLYEAEYRMKHKNGDYIWVRGRGIALFNGNKSPYRMVGTISDISQQKKYEAELVQHRINLKKLVRERTFDLEIAKKRAEVSDKLKTSFLQNISHEIRTPMNAIVGFSNLLKVPDLSKENKNEFIEKIETNCKTLIQLFDDIIFISKLQTEDIKINRAKTYLSCLFEDVYQLYQNVLDKEDQKELDIKLIKAEIPDRTCVFIDSELLKKVLTNLIDNAIKFTDKGGIEIGYSVDNDKLNCYIKDSGIGIPKDKKESIFELFRKIEDDMSRLYRGTGLGLTICKSIMKVMNGEIWLESEVGVGTTFHFSLSIKECGEI